MKKSILSLLLFVFSCKAWTCDTVLQGTRDCQIQDRFRQVRSELKNLNIDVNDIAIQSHSFY